MSGMGGKKLNSWFNVYNFSYAKANDLKAIQKLYCQDDLRETIALLKDIIIDEQKLLPNQDLSRIFLGGFSQGAMVSISTLFAYEWSQPLGGVLCLSGK